MNTPPNPDSKHTRYPALGLFGLIKHLWDSDDESHPLLVLLGFLGCGFAVLALGFLGLAILILSRGFPAL